MAPDALLRTAARGEVFLPTDVRMVERVAAVTVPISGNTALRAYEPQVLLYAHPPRNPYLLPTTDPSALAAPQIAAIVGGIHIINIFHNMLHYLMLAVQSQYWGGAVGLAGDANSGVGEDRMARLEDLTIGASVEGLVPDAPVTVVSTSWMGSSVLELTYKDVSGRVANTLLYRDDEPRLSVNEKRRPWSFDAPADQFRLVSEAQRIKLAAMFDPLLAVHTSMVEPLPHQILAVYEQMLNRQPLRFLLADDPGAGKTIMAGLLIRELIARGDLERCLIVCPGNLAEQWQDELDQKFQLPFEIATNDKLEAARTGNWFNENSLAIARLDKLSRNEDIQQKLDATQWDLVVVDEAHKMSATYFGSEVKYTKRYRLGQQLSRLTRHLLLMTATPHNGKEEDFQLFMALLDGDRFEGRFRDGVHSVDCTDMMRRLVKEQLLKFDGKPLFPERRAYTVAYQLSGDEAQLYHDVTEYVREEFNRVERQEDPNRRGTVGFALTILQRRLASSPEAIYQSLRRRRERLESRLREAQLLQRGGRSALLAQLQARALTQEDIEEIEDDEAPSEESETIENEVADEATAAQTIEELKVEIDILRQLDASALRVRRSGVDRKWDELSKLLQDTPEMFDDAGNRRKLIIFTEHRDTLEYLKERIGTLIGDPTAIVTIQGGMGREQRRAAEEAFRFDKDVQILLATDAAGEGINLQRAHLMVNYDLPWNPNRLEQRFGRIHRIGQTEVCHCWNLVAHETREGDVYHKLLDKLEAQRKALGGRDAVFDVLGRLFQGMSLRKLLVDAVRYGEQPEVRARLEKAIEDAVSTEHLRHLLDQEALARDAMDTRRVQAIREDMERAEARRLQPHFIEAFFLEAFKRAGGQISRRENGRYEITRVPATVRQRDRQIGHGVPVLNRYERVTFHKSLINVAGKPTAAFICPGHPLLDALIDLTLEQNRSLMRQGAVLIDPGDPTDQPRILFYLEHAIRDTVQLSSGENRVISRQMQFVEFDAEGNWRDAGHAPYLDYRPPIDTERAQLAEQLDAAWLQQDPERGALRYAAEHLVPHHLQSVRDHREPLLDKAKRAVKERLTKEITHWDHRAQELRAQEEAGKKPRLNSTMAQQRADELEARLRRRLERIEHERQLSPSPPHIVGGALIIPQGLLDRLQGVRDFSSDADPAARERIERAAVDAVLAMERQLGREPQEMDRYNPGYDIESRDPNEPGRLRFIEVKGRVAGAETVTITKNEILTALNKPDDYILAIVSVDGDCTDVHYVEQPFQREPDFGVTCVTYTIADLLARGEVSA